MTEIFNLSALCRCCHADGNFKNLQLQYQYKNVVEIYSVMIQETFGLNLPMPPNNLSYTICDECIVRLRDANRFKQQIVSCEQKFHEYLQNEEAFTETNVKVEVDFEPSNKKVKKSELNDTGYSEVEIKLENADIDMSEDWHDDFEEVKSEEIKKESTDTKKNIKKEMPSRKVKKLTSKKSKTKNLSSNPVVTKPKKVKNKREINCGHCKMSFCKISLLTKHCEEEHGLRGPYKCTDCSEEYDTYETISEHVKNTHGKDEVQCRFCNKEFNTKLKMTTHESTVHLRNMKYVCDLCKKELNYKSSLRKHLLWHQGLSKKVACNMCTNTFTDKCNLKIHIDTVHLDIRKFNCTLCEKSFKFKKHLKHHFENAHNNGQAIVCELCNLEFTTRQDLNKHSKEVHNIIVYNKKVNNKKEYPNRIYKCKGCTETFDNRGKFRSHTLKHGKNGALPLICDICGTGFSNSYTLKRHIENHKGAKPFKCKLCGKCFGHNTQLNRHVRNVHELNKPEKVKCPTCKLNVRDMEKHLKRHIERPHQCDLCHRSYPEKSILNRHRKLSHLKIYKHGCNICNLNCSTAKNLEKHNLKFHHVVKNDVDEVNYEITLANFTADGEILVE